MKTQTQCFAVPGGDSIIDTINPETGRSSCFGKTLDEIQFEHPGAEVVALGDFCNAKGIRQNAEPRDWREVTEDRYDEMLNVLPPAAYIRGAFLVGEAYDHHAGTGRPRFQCFKTEGGKHYELSGTYLTHAQFCEMFGACPNNYSE